MEFLNRNKAVIGFLAKLGILCAIYFWWFKPNAWTLPVVSTYYGHFIHYTLKYLVEPSVWILNMLGYGAEVVRLREVDMYDMDFNIHVRNYCLGTDMMFTLVALILSFPGKWINRLWFIPLGLIGVQFINIARIVGLCISWVIWGTNGPIDHHDLYNLFAVGFIFLMFMAWVNMYTKKEPAR